MAKLHPTHRYGASGWQAFNEVHGRFENCERPPRSVKLTPVNEHDGWKYFADPSHQPLRVYTMKNQMISDADKRVLARYGQDIQLHLQLLRGVDAKQPLVAELVAAGEHLRMVLESGYWLEEIQ